jgi:hypothetical protein
MLGPVPAQRPNQNELFRNSSRGLDRRCHRIVDVEVDTAAAAPESPMDSADVAGHAIR